MKPLGLGALAAGGLLAVAGLVAGGTLTASAQEPDGAALYAEHCAACHGADLKGAEGAHAPDLTDADWRFGGEDLDAFRIQPADVERIVRFGIRSGHPQAVLASMMPGTADPQSRIHTLTDAQIDDLVALMQSLLGQPADAAAVKRGKVLYEGAGTCFDCHSTDARGDNSIGATDLTRGNLWLYGTDAASIRASIVEGRGGVMPGFSDQLTDTEIRAVSAFVYGKAGGYDF